jgi:uncharacterized membrane protein YkvA (DUF1232 family)
MAAPRWGIFRTLATAIRTAARPGSPGMGERLTSLPRLVRATFTGEYPGATKGRLLMIAAALAYVLSPVDLVPEAFLAVFGLADDAMVVSWIAAALINETEGFLAWERSNPAAQRASRSASADPAHETVRGNVVR